MKPSKLRNDRTAFMKRHVTGSLFTPLSGGKLPTVAGSYVEEGAAIVLIAENKLDVDEAVRQLIRIGLDNVKFWIPATEALAKNQRNPGIVGQHRVISTATLGESLQSNPKAAVLDVRSAIEFEEAQVHSAKNIAYTRLAARLDDIPRAGSLYVHCGSGLPNSIDAGCSVGSPEPKLPGASSPYLSNEYLQRAVT